MWVVGQLVCRRSKRVEVDFLLAVERWQMRKRTDEVERCHPPAVSPQAEVDFAREWTSLSQERRSVALVWPGEGTAIARGDVWMRRVERGDVRRKGQRLEVMELL